eukprot:COSAG02_NODE_1613_length_11675_cov_8.562716_1_plen_54_part_00
MIVQWRPGEKKLTALLDSLDSRQTATFSELRNRDCLFIFSITYDFQTLTVQGV